MTGYVRKDTTNNIADGNVINAADLDSEFDGVQAAFNASTGHKHDGTASEGATINSLGPTQDVTISASLVAPKTTNFVDIGSSGLKFKDMFLAGNGSIGGTLAVTGVATFTAQPILSSLTASRAVFSDGSKGLVSNAITGTGNVVMSASPTLTGTVGGASLSLSSLTSGRVTYAGASGLLQDSANLLFNGTTLTANTLNLTNALGTAYGGTGLTSFTANGVVYASSSSALATGSALTFDGNYFTVASGTGSFLADILQVSGTATKVNANGVGLELRGSATPNITAYNRVTSAYLPMTLDTSASIFSISGSEGMRLTSTGLGIGTSSPAQKFVVSNGGAAGVEIVPTGGSQGGTYVQAYNRSGAAFVPTEIIASKIGFYTGTPPTFSALLDSSGNLGLGVTPSAWGGGYKALQINNGGLVTNTGGTFTAVTANAYYDGTNYIYVSTAAASLYRQNASVHDWQIAPSGTAGNAITFTQAMTLDASGNLLVGVTSTTNTNGGLILRQNGNGVDLNASGSTGAISIRGTASTGAALIDFYPVSSNPASAPFYSGRIFYSFADNYLSFATNGTERARIDSSGNLLVGTTSLPTTQGFAVLAYAGGTYTRIAHNTSAVSSDGFIQFYRDSSQIGSISQDGTTGVLYNITSDQRLKENIQNSESASDLIDAIQVRQFDWKSDGSHQRYGFVAQELVTVAPEAVNQPADPEDMMAVDYSKLVPMLVKEIQSLRIRIAQLEAK